MPVAAMRILITGRPAPGTDAMLARLTARGCGSHAVKTLREARDMLGTFRFDVVLAAESLPDGRGYELAEVVARRSSTLLVGVALSESCLWLPVVERGDYVLGLRAVNSQALELELELILGLRIIAAEGNIPPGRLRDSRELSDRTTSPRRKNGGAVAQALGGKQGTDRPG